MGGFPTTWLEIQPLPLVAPDVVVAPTNTLWCQPQTFFCCLTYLRRPTSLDLLMQCKLWHTDHDDETTPRGQFDKITGWMMKMIFLTVVGNNLSNSLIVASKSFLNFRCQTKFLCTSTGNSITIWPFSILRHSHVTCIPVKSDIRRRESLRSRTSFHNYGSTVPFRKYFNINNM